MSILTPSSSDFGRLDTLQFHIEQSRFRMEQIWRLLVFTLMCGFALTSGASTTNYPVDNYQSFEEDAIYGVLRSWNASGTNVSALTPSWSSNVQTHPCNSTAFFGASQPWITCSSQLVHIQNLTGYDYTLTAMSIVGPEYGGGVELVGELPMALLNLTNLQSISITGHRKLSGSLPNNILNKALPSMTSISFRGCNLSGNVTLATDSLREVQLSTLDLSDNHFTGATPFCQHALQYSLSSLNLSHNQFTGAFCNNESAILQTLDLRNNQFTGINVRRDAFLLQFVYAQHNRFQMFPSQLLQLPQVQEIYLDSNMISGTLSLPFVSPSNSSLRLISLVNNNITNLTPSNESSSLLSESNLKRLELLFLGGNPICKDSKNSDILRLVCRFNASSPIEGVNNQSSKTAIIISVCMGAVVIVALIITLLIIKKLMKKVSIMQEIQKELDKTDVKPNLYSYSELRTATQDFHSNNELGRGGFGVVYKGVLIDGTKVAVKRLIKTQKEQDIHNFLNEIIVLSNVKHRNLVQLKGCCIKEGQRLLVHELVDNKNLASMLWGDAIEEHLDWGARFNIILGIARGLAYLHEEVEPPIIHRDIKAQNILLDKNLNPKIADFGLALLLPSLDDGETHVNISNVAGTMGYLSPEYATYGEVSTKLDVFSFGVLALEIVSKRKNIDPSLPSEQLCLTLWAQRLHAKDQILELVDKSFQDKTTTEDSTIKRVVEVGLMCLHHVAARRPTMSSIVAMLIGNKELDRVALHGYHQTYLQDDHTSTSSSLPSIESQT